MNVLSCWTLTSFRASGGAPLSLRGALLLALLLLPPAGPGAARSLLLPVRQRLLNASGDAVHQHPVVLLLLLLLLRGRVARVLLLLLQARRGRRGARAGEVGNGGGEGGGAARGGRSSCSR